MALLETTISPVRMTPFLRELEIKPDVVRINARPPTEEYDSSASPKAELQSHLRGDETTNLVPNSLRANWGQFQRCNLSDALRNRVALLAQLENGWRGGNSKALAPASLRTFLTLWSQLPQGSKDPFLTLAPNGNLFLEWHASWKRHLDIECLPGNAVIFGLIDRQTTLEGKAALQEAIASIVAASENAVRWKS